MHQLALNPNGSEQLEYTLPGVPVRIGGGRLSIFQNYAAACHWHDDFEMLQAVDGEMDCFVNGRVIHMNRGEAVFVNARRLHYGFSAAMRDCGYRFAVFHPSLLGDFAPIAQTLEALTAAESADCWRVEPSSEAMMVFTELRAFADAHDAVKALAKCAELVALFRDMEAPGKSAEHGQDWAILRRMTGYIQNHCAERVTLQQLAAAGAVCRSRCCALFREHLNCTPIEYVNTYRMDKACAALREGHAVTEAALSSGFHSASYFAELFRRAYGVTPREYQRRAGQ